MKTFTLFLVILIISSCKNDISNKYLGNWIDRKTESRYISISKADNNFVITIDNNKFPGSIQNNILTVSIGSEEFKLIYENQLEIIIFNGEEFIREVNSISNNFIGIWYNSVHGANDMVEIRKTGSKIVWKYLSAFEGIKSVHYPVITNKGLTFKYGENNPRV